VFALIGSAALSAGCLDLAAPQNTLQFQFPGQDDANNGGQGCTSDANCPLGQVCQANACVVGCRTNTDCNAGELCIGEPRKCTVGGDCIQDADCPATAPRCHPALLLCVSCLLSIDCPGDEVCSVEPECSGGARSCVVGDFSCGGCTSDAQCAPATCDLDTGACVDCTSDAACPIGKYCDTERNICTGCTTDAHCEGNPDGPACLVDELGSYCVPCTRDSHCGAEGTCNQDTSTCTGCRSDSDCLGEGLRCNGVTGLCWDSGCTFRDVPELIELTVEASFAAPYVASAPLVAPLVDRTGEGVRNERDTAQLFVPMRPPSGAELAFRVLTLQDQTVWTTSAIAGGARFAAVGDLDGDNQPETVVVRGDRVTIHDRAGSTLATSGFQTGNVPTLFDVDQDGYGEILAGAALYSEVAERVWIGTAHQGGHGGHPAFATAAQLDGAEGLEVIAGGTIYATQGEVVCTEGEDGFGALVDLDGDAEPELVVVSDRGAVRALTADCRLLWGPLTFGAEAADGGPPLLADVSGDGAPDIVFVASPTLLVALDGAGGTLWTAPLTDAHPAAGVSAADLDGDGVREVLVSDAEGLRVLRGTDGYLLTSSPEGRARLALASPVVADIDIDGAVEIVVASTRGGQGDRVVVLGDVRNRWTAGRNLWNQLPYIPEAIASNLHIPAAPAPSWQGSNVFRAQPTSSADSPAPNLRIELQDGALDNSECPDRYRVTVRVYNRGALTVPSGVLLSARWPDPGQGLTPLLETTTRTELSPGDDERVVMVFDDLMGPVSFEVVARRADEDTFASPECRDDDNVILVEGAGCDDTF